MKVFLDTNLFLVNIVMSMVTAVGVSHKRLSTGINDRAFDDVEDSFQYQCAMQNKCDALITINLKDYRGVDSSKIEVLSPTEFVEKYL